MQDAPTPQALYEAHGGLVGLALSRWCPCCRGEELEDLRQECRVALWQAAMGYQGERGAFSTYAMRRMHGAVFHWLSRKRQMVRIPEHVRLAGMPVMSVTLECELEYGLPEVVAEAGERPLECLQTLGTTARGIVQGWLDGWTDAELARREGVSTAVIWSKRHRAFDRLRRRMGG